MDKFLSTSFQISPLDQDRFNIKVAKAHITDVRGFEKVVRFCDKNSVELLISRCNGELLNIVHLLEKNGFLLMDTLIYFTFDLKKKNIPTDPGNVVVRKIRTGEELLVKEAAALSFKGYFGHYHADNRLEQSKSDEIYIDWAYRSAIKEAADEVLVAEINDQIVGFATLKLNSKEEGEGVLFGIIPAAQRLGIYSSFIIQGLIWCQQNGCQSMIVSTQIINIPVQKVWTRVGFEPAKFYYTFHKWFD